MAVTLLASTGDVLNELIEFLKENHTAPGTEKLASQLKNHHRRSVAFSRTAGHLHQRTQTASQLLANTLSFHDQVVAKEQNETMLQLSKSAVFITTLTLFYVPASYSAVSFLLRNGPPAVLISIRHFLA